MAHIQQSLEQMCICEACHSTLSMQENVSKRSGWAQSFTLACTNTNGDIQPIDIEPLKGDNKKMYPINDQCVLGFRANGKGHLHANKLSSILDLPPLLTNQAFARCTRKLDDISEKVVQEKFSRAASITKDYKVNR